MKEERRSKETLLELRLRKFDYVWVDLKVPNAKTLEPVMYDFTQVGMCYINGNDYIAKLTLYQLEEDRILLSLIVFSQLVLRAGDNCHELPMYYVPQIALTDELDSSDSALPYIRRVIDNRGCNANLEGDNYLAWLIQEKKNFMSLPWNYDFLLRSIEEVQTRSFHAFYARRLERQYVPLTKNIVRSGYKEAEINLVLSVQGNLRDTLKKRAKLKTMFSRENCLELQLKEQSGEEELFKGTIFDKFSSRGRSFEPQTRFEFLTHKEMVEFTSKKTVFEQRPHVYDTTMTITTSVTLLIKSPDQQKEVRIYDLKLPEHYVIGEIFYAIDALNIWEEIPSKEDLTD